jgi:hypothetical protein
VVNLESAGGGNSAYFADYAVLIVGAVFLFAALSWMFSARHWFTGPVKTVEDGHDELQASNID